MGFFNRGSTTVRGVQIGCINVAKDLRGLQIGLVNVAANGRIKLLPLVNARF